MGSSNKKMLSLIERVIENVFIDSLNEKGDWERFTLSQPCSIDWFYNIIIINNNNNPDLVSSSSVYCGYEARSSGFGAHTCVLYFFNDIDIHLLHSFLHCIYLTDCCHMNIFT